MSIYKKLLEIQRHISGLKKDAKGFGFEYVSGNKILGEIKPKMNELGLILKQEIISIENVRHDYKTKNGEKSEINSKVMIKFTWVDCETGEKDENLFGANGQNDWDKGVGSALTYAERYFLLKYFHIATDEDDIDNPERKTSEPIAVRKAVEPTATSDEYDQYVELLTEETIPTPQKLNEFCVMVKTNKVLTQNERGALATRVNLFAGKRKWKLDNATKTYLQP